MEAFLKYQNGFIKITENEGHITKIQFVNKDEFKINSSDNSKLLSESIKQIEGYLLGKRKILNFPVKVNASDFQKRVWNALREIPHGEVLSYGELAKKLGGVNYSRAVGGACNKNPLLLYYPCHRVISSKGIGGFAIDTNIKRSLLILEGVTI